MPPLKLSPLLSGLSRSLRAAKTPLPTAAAATTTTTTTTTTNPIHSQTRWAHSTNRSAAARIPAPIPLVPDVATFLKVIGRGLSQHASKIPTWEALFTLTSDQLRELGIEPARTRRYLIEWRQKYREGRFGVGGDLRFVRDGAADFKVLDVAEPRDGVVRARVVVNVPAGTPAAADAADLPAADRAPARGFRAVGVRGVSGPYVLPLKGRGAGARLTVTEGMWEDKVGRKIDGGERRRDEIRFKRRVAERRAAREAGGGY
ncbi:hypothetical protein RB595_001506 [Gaeumannomyces hyphopodioides]